MSVKEDFLNWFRGLNCKVLHNHKVCVLLLSISFRRGELPLFLDSLLSPSGCEMVIKTVFGHRAAAIPLLARRYTLICDYDAADNKTQYNTIFVKLPSNIPQVRSQLTIEEKTSYAVGLKALVISLLKRSTNWSNLYISSATHR